MTVTNCQRCDGSGVYNGTRRDGSTYTGPCFACQGGGPRFVRRAYRAAPQAVTVGSGAHAVAVPVIAPVWNARQQAHLDAFAVAQPAAWTWLVNNRDAGNEFAASLLNGCARYGGLTPRQLAAVERNLNRPAIAIPMVATPAMPSDSAIGFIDPIPAGPDLDANLSPVALRAAYDAAVPAAVAPVIVNLDRVRRAMESARASGLRRVRLTFGDVTMQLSGPTFRSGAGLILCYHRGGYKGHVDTGNVWHARVYAPVSDETLDAFRAVGADPQAAARTYGQDTGHCACCRRLLTDPVSVMANIGPVCARRFGWSF